jgi:hypothetical protein
LDVPWNPRGFRGSTYPALGFAVGILTGIQILLAKFTQVGGYVGDEIMDNDQIQSGEMQLSGWRI